MALTDFYEETTKEFTGQITLNGSNPDITSDTVTLYMYQVNGSATVQKDADVSLGSGQYKVTLSKTDTDVAPDRYKYEIWWTRSTGEQYVLETSEEENGQRVEILDSLTKT